MRAVRNVFSNISLVIATLGMALAISLGGCTWIFPTELKRYIEYPIQKGDTLDSISTKFGVPVSEIERANDIDDPRKLVIGTKLLVPFSGHPESGGAKAGVKPPGDLPSKPDPGSAKLVLRGAAKRQIDKLAWPVPNGIFVSRFGSRWLSFHEGIDLSAPQGTPIYAAQDGVVAYSGDGLRGYGNLIVVRGDGMLTVYAHNRSNRVSVGDKVSRGDRIATVGATGKATGPHLHYETRVQNEQGKFVAVDPMVFYPSRLKR